MAKLNKPDKDAFIKHYVLTGCKNGRKAAIEAGYSEKTADQAASRLLKDVKVQAAIEEHQKASMKSFIWSKEKKLQMLEKIIECATTKDDEKGMINMPSAIAAMKEHNIMQGDNAPTEIKADVNVRSTIDDFYATHA